MDKIEEIIALLVTYAGVSPLLTLVIGSLEPRIWVVNWILAIAGFFACIFTLNFIRFIDLNLLFTGIITIGNLSIEGLTCAKIFNFRARLEVSCGILDHWAYQITRQRLPDHLLCILDLLDGNCIEELAIVAHDCGLLSDQSDHWDLLHDRLLALDQLSIGQSHIGNRGSMLWNGHLSILNGSLDQVEGLGARQLLLLALNLVLREWSLSEGLHKIIIIESKND